MKVLSKRYLACTLTTIFCRFEDCRLSVLRANTGRSDKWIIDIFEAALMPTTCSRCRSDDHEACLRHARDSKQQRILGGLPLQS